MPEIIKPKEAIISDRQWERSHISLPSTFRSIPAICCVNATKSLLVISNIGHSFEITAVPVMGVGHAHFK
jgi:hypothetical protein